MNNSPLTIPPVSRAAPAAIVGVASAAMMGAPERALCQRLNYLDKPFVPLAVALRSMLAETETKILAAAPAEKSRLQQRAEVLPEWLTPKSRA